nr:helix-turn-helix transcriptional regulator [Oscillospiraceae bacterium]
ADIHLSEGECCRVFKSAYGCSIFTYLADYRLQKSIPLLADRTLSVTRIAELCGFNSPSYFIKRFREKVGMSPLQYRSNAGPAAL